MTPAEISERAGRFAKALSMSREPYAERSGYTIGALRHIRDGCETLAEARQLARDTLAVLDASSRILEAEAEVAPSSGG